MKELNLIEAHHVNGGVMDSGVCSAIVIGGFSLAGAIGGAYLGFGFGAKAGATGGGFIGGFFAAYMCY